MLARLTKGNGLPAVAAPLLEVLGLARRYGRHWALAGIDLRVAPGAAVLVAGHNRSGKSTLLRVLAGALRPDRGSVRLDGVESREGLRRATALLSHRAFTYEPLSALQNLAIAARFLGQPSSRASLLPLLDRVGLAARADAAVQTFSAGMRKRLALARVLLQRPRIALLDEPYGELDPQGFHLLDEIVRELREGGSTVLLASHLVERGAAMCERAVLLDHGRVAYDGPAPGLLSSGLLHPSAADSPIPEAV